VSVDRSEEIGFRHLSVSIMKGRRGRGPTPEVVAMVMEEFGFRGSPLEPDSRLAIYTENLLDGTLAVNVLEPLQHN
jgi:hypothetical protein